MTAFAPLAPPLGSLETAILSLAYHNRRTRRRERQAYLRRYRRALAREALTGVRQRPKAPRHHPTDLLVRHVLVWHYQFEPARPDWADQRRGIQCFDRDVIGRRRYHAASQSVSACFRRLHRRGLIHFHGAFGATLTRKGVTSAKAILYQTR